MHENIYDNAMHQMFLEMVKAQQSAEASVGFGARESPPFGKRVHHVNGDDADAIPGLRQRQWESHDVIITKFYEDQTRTLTVELTTRTRIGSRGAHELTVLNYQACTQSELAFDQAYKTQDITVSISQFRYTCKRGKARSNELPRYRSRRS